MADGGFQCLPEGHDLLMRGVAGWRHAALRHRFLKAMNSVLLDLAGSDF
jgi:hypothetical protein